MSTLHLNKVRHPNYYRCFNDWVKFRFVYEGGQSFINEYLEQFSRETDSDFNMRRGMTYSPSFAKSCLLEIKNSIYSRMNDISRTEGDQEYQNAIVGLNGGVDQEGSGMNLFIGTKVLEELLVMGKVGMMVDMPHTVGNTLRDNKGKRPYLYYYRAEDIFSWDGEYLNGEYKFTKLLVSDEIEKYDEETGLPCGNETVYRMMCLMEDGYVRITRWTMDDETEFIEELPLIKMTRIPFVVLNISHSLLTDVANYQIALLNLCSTGMDYALRSNYPFYTEQYEPRASNQYASKTVNGTGVENEEAEEIVIGRGTGRRYPIGSDRPGFIHPSAEPLKISMEKQEQMKREIRQLMQLNIASLEPTRASAESKGMDSRSLESGLGYIGLELERGERLVAEFWAMFQGTKAAAIHYPLSYELKSDASRQEETSNLESLMPAVPSLTYKKQVAKKMSTTLLGNCVSKDVLDKIHSEIDQAPFITSKPEDLKNDVELGLVSKATASLARGYPEDEVEKGRKERAEDLALIQAAQSNNGARGLDNPAAKGIREASIDAEEDQQNDGGGRAKGE